MTTRRALLLAALALSSSAAAFQPTDLVDLGAEPQRQFPVNRAEQSRLRNTPAFARFDRAHRQGDQRWTVRFDEATGTPLRLYGPGIDLGALPTEAAVLSALRQALAPHADLLGASPHQLAWQEGGYVARRDAWIVDLDVLREGLPIWRGGITARIQQGRLTMLGALTYPDSPVTGAFVLDAAAAQRTARDAGPAADAVHTDHSAVAMLFPIETANGIELRRVWHVTSATSDPPGRWNTLVDAQSGEALARWNEVRFFDASVQANHHQRNPDGPLVWSPAVFQRVESTDGLTTARTDVDGNVTIDDADPTAIFYGPDFDIDNDDGPDAQLPLAETTDWTTAHATQAEIDTWVFLHRIREWGIEVAPEIDLVNMRLQANVNLDQNCNAYFDGGVNFFKAGQGCRNTGELSDVIFHEWGHGFHYWSLLAGDFDGDLSEGAADVVAFLQTGDPIIAPGFMNNGNGIREVSRNRVYPDDMRAGDVHGNGLIFGGAIWDFWGELQETIGDEAALATTEQLLADILKGGPTIATSYEEALFADDDDGNLANGTPNRCALIDAFGQHGLGPLGTGGALEASFAPPLEVEGSLDLNIDVANVASECFAVAPTDAFVEWRSNGGAWQLTELNVDGDSARGAIPEQEPGTFVEYLVIVEDDSGGTFTLPEGGRINPHSFYAGGVLEVMCNDFEDNDGGFTSELVSGQESEGANDWQWGSPNGVGGDPSRAYSGTKVWGNDLGAAEFNGEYQNEKHNRLRSPELSTGHYDGVFLRYLRWLTVEDGFFDQASIHADETTVWSNWATTEDRGDEHHLEQGWAPHVVHLMNAADDGSVRLSWELQSDQGLAFGGWNIDDVCLLAPATPDNRLGIDDLTVTAGDSVTLSWTNPKHAPLREVVVVRTRRGWPSGPDDGQVVWRSTEPELGALMSITDDGRGEGWAYAVYASDGEDWLSWTRPGLNADSVDGTEASGCGCTSTPSPAGGSAMVALLALLGLRRRRNG